MMEKANLDPSASRIKVLIVEDDPINLFVARKLLETQFEIACATNDKEVFTVLESEQVDVILMDINLGANSLDGIQVMQKVKETYQEQQIPIYAVTSYAMPDDEKKYLSVGFDRYFVKPIERQKIIATIKEQTGRT